MRASDVILLSLPVVAVLTLVGLYSERKTAREHKERMDAFAASCGSQPLVTNPIPSYCVEDAPPKPMRANRTSWGGLIIFGTALAVCVGYLYTQPLFFPNFQATTLMGGVLVLLLQLFIWAAPFIFCCWIVWAFLTWLEQSFKGNK